MSPLLIGAASARVLEQQPQGLLAISGETGQVQVAVIGNHAALEQDPHDRRVGLPGNRAAERSPAAGARRSERVGAGVQQQPRNRRESVSSGRIEAVPA